MGQHMELGRWGLFESAEGVSMAFLTMNFMEMFHAICMRSQRGSIFAIRYQNLWLWGALALTALFTFSVMYVPFFIRAFGFTSINLMELLAAFSLALAIIPLVELEKLIQRRITAGKLKKA